MAHKPDAVTAWWRRISLRAKVTGVTVAVLALGLLVAGIGTVPLLRNALVENINAQLPALVTSDLVNRYFDTTTIDGVTTYTPRDEKPRDFSFAVYDAEGTLRATAPSASGRAPVFPAEYSLSDAQANEEQVLALEDADGGVYHAAAAVVQQEGDPLSIQMVALPLAEADRIISQYFGIYITIALITIFVAALLTRGLVTLTFRRLGQVEQTAMSIAAGDFRQRLTDLEPTTEVGRLNAAINTMLDRVDRSSPNATARCSTCAGSSETPVTSCGPRSSACAGTPSCTAWARSRARRTPLGRWSASRRRRSAWACSWRISSRSHGWTRSASRRSSSRPPPHRPRRRPRRARRGPDA